MRRSLGDIVLGLAARRRSSPDPAPLLVELLQKPADAPVHRYHAPPFRYQVSRRGPAYVYSAWCELPPETFRKLRRVVREASDSLDPSDVEPLSFGRLVQVLTEDSAARLAGPGTEGSIKELSELAAYEALGLSRVLALAKDQQIAEFYVDSDFSPLYVDHGVAGRCGTSIFLTERERRALQTHADTFGGYSLDYRTPSLKNDLEIAGAILRVSLDLEPISANRFALDVRRLNPASFSLSQLVGLRVLTLDSAAFLVAWLEVGGNVTIIGETGTGKTTLLNALDEQLEPQLRRLYVEDAVETADLLRRGFHQAKLKVDPFERGEDSGRTKANEIVKALHRSPDLLILSEIQSEEHSGAFFHALSAGARGMQTFHASTAEQAMRRWVNMHRIPEESLLDLGLMVQMERPDRLQPKRYVRRICRVVPREGKATLEDVYVREGEGNLRPAGHGPTATGGADDHGFREKMEAASVALGGRGR
jgi:type IV secretory pathway ATPase VirB11/archaellum biosynthesis ATPase